MSFHDFYHINFLIYLDKKLFLQINHIKFATGAVQTLRCFAYKIKNDLIETIY